VASERLANFTLSPGRCVYTFCMPSHQTYTQDVAFYNWILGIDRHSGLCPFHQSTCFLFEYVHQNMCVCDAFTKCLTFAAKLHRLHVVEQEGGMYLFLLVTSCSTSSQHISRRFCTSDMPRSRLTTSRGLHRSYFFLSKYFFTKLTPIGRLEWD
jgi:hypothetical protein